MGDRISHLCTKPMATSCGDSTGLFRYFYDSLADVSTYRYCVNPPPLGLLYPRHYAKALRNKRRDKLRLQFKEALHALSSLLSAGRSVENAFSSLENDLILLIGDSHSDLMLELRAITNRLHNGEPLEVSLQDFAEAFESRRGS